MLSHDRLRTVKITQQQIIPVSRFSKVPEAYEPLPPGSQTSAANDIQAAGMTHDEINPKGDPRKNNGTNRAPG